MKILRTAALLFVGLSGCERIPGTMKHEVASHLIDPTSAKIEVTHKTSDLTCGLVNGKNRMGAYAGATPFIWTKSIGLSEIYDEPDMSDYRSMRYGGSDTEHQEAAMKITTGCAFVEKWEQQCASSIHYDKDLCRLWKAGDMQALSAMADDY